MRCGEPVSERLKLKLPLASVLVRAASCIPSARFSNTTSSPLAGLPTVAFLTLPVRVSADADAAKVRSNATEIIERQKRPPIVGPQEVLGELNSGILSEGSRT